MRASSTPVGFRDVVKPWALEPIWMSGANADQGTPQLTSHHASCPDFRAEGGLQRFFKSFANEWLPRHNVVLLRPPPPMRPSISFIPGRYLGRSLYSVISTTRPPRGLEGLQSKRSRTAETEGYADGDRSGGISIPLPLLYRVGGREVCQLQCTHPATQTPRQKVRLRHHNNAM